MRNSAIDKKKTVVSVKLNGKQLKSDDFSDVSEQGSIEQTEQNQESVDEQIGWSYFHQSKLQIENLVKEIIPKYKQYRNILYESIKQICLESNLAKYDYSRLAKEPEAEQSQLMPKAQLVYLDDKVNMVEKIISERRIKKYYKNKHEINFQDELDPQDDERQIYRLYQQAFFKKEQANPKQPKRPQKQSDVIYNQQYLVVPQSGTNIVNSKISQIGNRILDLSNQYNVDVDDESFERMKYQHQNLNAKKINYTKINDPFVGFQHQLSFDVKNQQYFVNNNENHQIDSFGFMEEEKDQINSQIKYDAEKLKKFNKIKNTEKSGDQYSHTDNIFKNYVDKQHQELSKQKLRVQELAQKAQKVLNNDLEYQQVKPENINSQQDKLAQFRYLLGEIIQIYSVKECLKYTLKFKSYQLLNKLYQNASDYYGEEISFQEPLQVKYLSQIIKAALPQQQQDGIRIVVHNIFANAESITYQQFLERLTPSINDKEYDALQSVNYTTSSNKSFDLTVRLFNIWIQIDYFEKQLKTLLQNNQEIVDKFIQQTTQNAMLMPHLIAEFISKSKKFPKNKKIKSQIFFRKILGVKLMVSQFYRWIDSKSQKVNQKFKKQQQQEEYQFYYHLY